MMNPKLNIFYSISFSLSRTRYARVENTAAHSRLKSPMLLGDAPQREEQPYIKSYFDSKICTLPGM